MTEQTQKSQANLRAILSMRGTPTWVQGLTLVAALVVAHELDRHIGGWTGSIVGVVVALVVLGIAQLLWRVYRR